MNNPNARFPRRGAGFGHKPDRPAPPQQKRRTPAPNPLPLVSDEGSFSFQARRRCWRGVAWG
jgi:hypothetical protein